MTRKNRKVKFKRLRQAIARREEAAWAIEDPKDWKPWPNTLPRSVLGRIDALVNIYEEYPRSLDLHDLAVIAAQASYDAGRRRGMKEVLGDPTYRAWQKQAQREFSKVAEPLSESKQMD